MSLYPKPLFISAIPTSPGAENVASAAPPKSHHPIKIFLPETSSSMGQRPNHPYMTPQPKKVQQLRGKMSVTPLPKRRQSGEKRYAVTPGVGQRLNISRAQQLMQGYQIASKPTPGRKVSVASNPHVTPSRSRASASADLDPAARATAL